MAKQRRKKVERRFVYFYLNDALHRALQINRADDTIIAWNFVEGKRVAYNYSDVQKSKRHAYTISEVAKLINRHVDTVKRHLRAGDFPKPQQSHALDNKEKLGRYYFSENDIRIIREFFRTVHIGRPRNDGNVTASNIPSKAELEALLRNETVLYAKNDQGEFVPVWKQPEW